MTRVQDLFKFARMAYDAPSPNQKTDLNALSVTFHDSSIDNKNCCTQFYIIVFPNEIIFAIRGSTSLTDLLIDIQFLQTDAPDECTKNPNARVHRGFLKQFRYMYDFVRKTVDETEHTNITFIGHSLGGALATLCSAATKTQYNDEVHVECYTYGSPRVGNAEFVKSFDENVDVSVRCVNGSDIAPMRPYFGYAHVQSEHRIGHVRTDWPGYLLGSIDDHTLDNYQRGLFKPSGSF